MKRWLIRKWLEPILSRPIIRSIEWTEAERAQFDSFLCSSCGIKLFEFLRQLVANTTFKAVYHNSVSANAHARGMQDILGVFQRLRVFPVQVESEETLEEFPMPEPQPKKDSGWNPYGAGRGAISK
jgi:hypothetical protein